MVSILYLYISVFLIILVDQRAGELDSDYHKAGIGTCVSVDCNLCQASWMVVLHLVASALCHWWGRIGYIVAAVGSTRTTQRERELRRPELTHHNGGE